MLVLVFPLGPEVYALPLRDVREVVAAPILTTLPTAPPAVMGLANLRGDVLPVFDVTRLLGSPFPTPARFVMVVDTAGGPAGFATSGLPSIVDIEPAPGSVYAVGGGPVVLIDLVALMTDSQAGA